MYVCLIFELARERQRYCLVIFSPNNLQSPSQQETFSNTVDTLFKCHRICVSLEITAFLRGLPSSFPKKYSIQSRLQFIKKNAKFHAALWNRDPMRIAWKVLYQVLLAASEVTFWKDRKMWRICAYSTRRVKISQQRYTYNRAFVSGHNKICKLSKDFHAPSFISKTLKK